MPNNYKITHMSRRPTSGYNMLSSDSLSHGEGSCTPAWVPVAVSEVVTTMNFSKTLKYEEVYLCEYETLDIPYTPLEKVIQSQYN